MKRTLLILVAFVWMGLCGLSATARAWEDGETFRDKWNAYWKGAGEDLDTAGRSFRDTFLKPNSDD